MIQKSPLLVRATAPMVPASQPRASIAPAITPRDFLLQDWITVRSSLTTPFIQDCDSWLDLDGYSDVSCWIDIIEVTPPPLGAGATWLILQLETSPSPDDAYFVALAPALRVGTAAGTTPTSTTPIVVRSAKSTVTNNLMRYLRWKITPVGSGVWDITFRIHAIAARSSTFVPPVLPGCVVWYRADLGLTLSGSSVTAWNDQSGAGDANKNLNATGTPTFNLADASYMNQSTIGFSGSSQYFTSGRGLRR